MVVAELRGDLLPRSTGRMWMQARRPELYRRLTASTGSGAQRTRPEVWKSRAQNLNSPRPGAPGGAHRKDFRAASPITTGIRPSMPVTAVGRFSRTAATKQRNSLVKLSV